MEIWEEIRADAEKGAKRLVAEFWDRLFGASLVLCKDEHAAEDLVMRTFAQVVVKIDQYDDRRPFWNWLYAILLNYFRGDLRKMKAEVGEDGDCCDYAEGAAIAPKPVAMGAYQMDSHHVRRHVGADGFVHNEGDVEVSVDAKTGKHFRPYPIDYGAVVPKRGECENLIVPVCLSASHIAFGSIRMEPVFFALGQVAGTAGAIAAADGIAVQDVPYADLSARLLSDGQVLGFGRGQTP